MYQKIVIMILITYYLFIMKKNYKWKIIQGSGLGFSIICYYIYLFGLLLDMIRIANVIFCKNYYNLGNYLIYIF